VVRLAVYGHVDGKGREGTTRDRITGAFGSRLVPLRALSAVAQYYITCAWCSRLSQQLLL